MTNCVNKIDNKQKFKRYDLKPLDDQQKSFYKKAYIEEYKDRSRVLYSYATPVLFITCKGTFYRLWDGWSKTTAQHIKAAIGRLVPKSEWESLKVNELKHFIK